MKNKRKKLKNRLLTVILILIVLSSSLSTNAIKIDNEKSHEIKIQLFGSDYKDSISIKITNEKLQEINNQIIDFNTNLSNSKNREETITFFKELISSANEIGILPEHLKIEEINDLITTKKVKTKNSIESKNCLIAGKTTNSVFIRKINNLADLTFGFMGTGAYAGIYPSNGWIFSNSNGQIDSIKGKLIGCLGSINSGKYDLLKGAEGFKGMCIEFENEKFFIGSSKNLKVESFNDITKPKTEPRINFIFARIKGTVESFEKKNTETIINGDLTVNGCRIIHTYPNEFMTFEKIEISSVKITKFFGILNNRRVNGIGIGITDNKEFINIKKENEDTLIVHVKDQNNNSLSLAKVTLDWGYGFNQKLTNKNGIAGFSITPPADVQITETKGLNTKNENIKITKENIPIIVDISLKKNFSEGKFLQFIFANLIDQLLHQKDYQMNKT